MAAAEAEYCRARGWREDRVREAAATMHGLPVPKVGKAVRNLVLTKLHAVGLRGAAHLQPQQLSGGMARRVALARAIVMDPQILLYDEPFAGLDPISMGVVMRLIRSLNDALGISSIVVTHDVREISRIADASYILSDGQVWRRPTELTISSPIVHQFMEGADGPVSFPTPRPTARAIARRGRLMGLLTCW
jgi:phospholipid/cholesterol/gamma-HCH transport system ATP-binding protein